MSFVRTIIRLSAVAAMRHKTWAHERVYDSDMTPLSDSLKIGEKPKPYIVVFTDADNRDNVQETSIHLAQRSMTLSIEIAVASAVQADDGKGLSIQLPHTDQAVEFAVDITETQALNALTDPENPWAEILRRLITRIVAVPSARGGRAERGSRWAARQVTIRCDTVCDAPAGVLPAVDSAIRDWIVLAKACPDKGISEPAEVIEKLLDSKDVYPGWEAMQAWLHVSRPTLRRIGLGPTAEDEDGVVAIITEKLDTDIVLQDPTREAPTLTQENLADEDTFTSDRIDYIPP